MKKTLGVGILLFLGLQASIARAELFAVDVNAEAGYYNATAIQNGDDVNRTLAGGTAGVRARVSFLFLNAMADYQHFFSNADLFHLGIGPIYKFPIPLLKPYIYLNLGLLMLKASSGALDPEPVSDLAMKTGFQGRAGGGMDLSIMPFLVVGAVVDAGYHRFKESGGLDYSILGYVGLRI